MKILYTSFFTPEYTDEARGLSESLDEFNLPYTIDAIKSEGEWTANCAKKPLHIKNTIMSLSSDAVVWLDADARVKEHPQWFYDLSPDVDIAIHKRQGVELLSGTIYARSSVAAIALLETWSVLCAKKPGEWDQRVLNQLIYQIPGLVIANMPAEYCCIQEFMPVQHPVIIHRQASRSLREKVGLGQSPE